jgi:hypothetical protein
MSTLTSNIGLGHNNPLLQIAGNELDRRIMWQEFRLCNLVFHWSGDIQVKTSK